MKFVVLGDGEFHVVSEETYNKHPIKIGTVSNGLFRANVRTDRKSVGLDLRSLIKIFSLTITNV